MGFSTEVIVVSSLAICCIGLSEGGATDARTKDCIECDIEFDLEGDERQELLRHLRVYLRFVSASEIGDAVGGGFPIPDDARYDDGDMYCICCAYLSSGCPRRLGGAALEVPDQDLRQLGFDQIRLASIAHKQPKGGSQILFSVRRIVSCKAPLPDRTRTAILSKRQIKLRVTAVDLKGM